MLLTSAAALICRGNSVQSTGVQCSDELEGNHGRWCHIDSDIVVLEGIFEINDTGKYCHFRFAIRTGECDELITLLINHLTLMEWTK